MAFTVCSELKTVNLIVDPICQHHQVIIISYENNMHKLQKKLNKEIRINHDSLPELVETLELIENDDVTYLKRALGKLHCCFQ